MKTSFRNHHSINWCVLIGFQKLFVKRIVENVLCCVLINETNDSSIQFSSAEKIHQPFPSKLPPDNRIYAGGCIRSIDNTKEEWQAVWQLAGKMHWHSLSFGFIRV